MTIFVLFGALALASAVAMVLQRNAVYAALLLVLNLFGIAVLFLTLGGEFLMVSQIIVYAGAIMVLFLFVMMLLGVDRAEDLREPRALQHRQWTFAVLLGGLLLVGLFATLVTKSLTEPFGKMPEGYGSPEAMGRTLFENWLLPFEVTSLLLLVAAIGILMLAKRKKQT